MLQTLNFNVTDVEFWCCRHVMLGFVSRRGYWCWMLHATRVATWSQHGLLCRGEGATDVGCCTQHRSQHGLIECCAREEEEGGGLPNVGCCMQHGLQHLLPGLQHLLPGLWNRQLTTDSLPIWRSQRCPMLASRPDVRTLTIPNYLFDENCFKSL
jgi:hypothetical protein